jgi:hypothetical protein
MNRPAQVRREQAQQPNLAVGDQPEVLMAAKCDLRKAVRAAHYVESDDIDVTLRCSPLPVRAVG